MRRLISPTSSMNSVPPWASSSTPDRSRQAPVKLPRVWPNSSDSRSDSGTPAQFRVMNGACERRLVPCSRWATISLPTPLSPVISTFASVPAAYPTSSSTVRIATLVPTSCSSLCWCI